MIAEWFLGLFPTIASWFVNMFGDDDPPSWIVDAASFVSGLFDSIAGLGGWVPFVVIGTVSGGLLLIWSVLWGIKGLRWLYGILPIAGGT
jgi:hypothetical protein